MVYRNLAEKPQVRSIDDIKHSIHSDVYSANWKESVVNLANMTVLTLLRQSMRKVTNLRTNKFMFDNVANACLTVN